MSAMSAKVPGSPGVPFVGDKSLSFYKDPIGFVQRNIDKHQSPIFQCRFLNQPTVFVCSNAAVQQVLQDEDQSFEMGYRAFMYNVYGHNVVFTEGDEARSLREILMKLFNDVTVDHFHEQLQSLCDKAILRIETESPAKPYPIMKQLCTEICLSLFLNIDPHLSRDLADHIVALTTTHWHGIISIPLKIGIPGIGQASSYAKALEAKQALLEIIEERMRENESSAMAAISESFDDAEKAQNHVLLFTSALVPKALASILTSFLLQLADKICESPQNLDNVLLEVLRLNPPMIGGRRLVKKSCDVAGYHIPKGHALMFITYFAQRDPEVFENASEFRPERWKNTGISVDQRKNLFVFGAGARCCIGQKLIWDILKTASRSIIDRFAWKVANANEPIAFKWLPVSRPNSDLALTFTSRTQHAAETSNNSG